MAALSGDWALSLRDRLDPPQVDRWVAWDSLHPLGNDNLMMLIAQLIQWTAASKGTEIKIEDLMPWTKPMEDEE